MTPPHYSLLVLRVSQQLHQHDLMNTSCAVNKGMEDEYLSHARDIVCQLGEGVPLRDALKRSFDHWFWEGCLLEDQRQSGVDALLASLTWILQEER